MRKTLLYLTILVVFSFSAMAQKPNTEKTPALIPFPTKYDIKPGQFALSASTQLQVSDGGRFTNEIYFLQTIMQSALGRNLSNEAGKNSIEIKYTESIQNEEGYTLDITPDRITLAARTPQGAFYGIQTIRQLLPYKIESGKNIPSSITLPALQIEDEPAFAWRGTMIDMSRHFFSIDYLKKHIDRLALYKMNKLHLHLSDDQGWRIEIKKYPKLTEQGAWRTYNNQDSSCFKLAKEDPNFEIDPRYIIKRDGEKDLYGGYYSQDQIRELVKYAASKHIELIPEIDMPGHMMAAIAAYPELTDSKHRGWGELFSTPLCPCKDEVYTFVEDVLTEVMELFPSQYIHIGADEVEKTTWKESELCKQLMAKEGITDVDKLQSYFIQKVQDFVESKGKKIIAWDEALDGGVNSNVNIMFWRGWEPQSPKKASANGNFVIISPNNPLYFDYLPNKTSIYNVYNMSVIADDVAKENRHLIKGAQANMWSETIPTEKRADYLLFPRLTALAERVWTNKDLYIDYSARLLEHYPRLDELNVNYRLPDIQGFALESIFTEEALFSLESPLPTMKVRYTTDGSIPTTSSAVLDKPIKVNKPMQFKVALFSEGGVRGDIYTINYRQMDISKAVAKNAAKMKKGLTCDFYNTPMDKTTKIEGKATKRFIAKNFVAPAETKAPSFGLRFDGYIHVPETGIYSFFFNCDDSGILYINEQVIVDNEGPHSPVEKSGQAALEKGLHPIRLDFVEGGGGYTLKMQYSVNGSEVKDIPDSWFVY